MLRGNIVGQIRRLIQVSYGYECTTRPQSGLDDLPAFHFRQQFIDTGGNLLQEISIRAEQDSGSDKLVVSHSPKPAREIAKNLLNAIRKLGELGESRPVPGGASAFTNAAGRFFAHFRLRNRVRSIMANDGKRIRMRLFPRIMMYILFVLVLVFQLLIVIDIGKHHLYLR